MHRRSTPRISFILAASVVWLAGCGEIIRGSAKILGADDLADRNSGGNSQNRNLVALIKGSHRTVEGRGPIVVTVVRRNPNEETVTIDFRSLEWTGLDRATPGSDYRSISGTLRWGPNDGSPRLVSIHVLRDQVYEGTEVFRLEFSNVRGGQSTVGSITCYIDDESTPPKLTSDVDELSAQRGGVQRLRLRAGVEHAGRGYLVAGSFGTSPGFTLGGLWIPLNIDPWFAISLQHVNGPNFHRTSGILNYQGEAFAELRSAPIPIPSVVGVRVHHAYVVYDAVGVFRMVSNPVSLTIVR